LAATDTIKSRIIFSLHQLPFPNQRYSENSKEIYCHKIKYQRFGQNWTNSKNQSKKLQQFTKLCNGNMSQNSKTAKMVLGRYYRVLNSRLALTRLAILNT